MPCPFCGAIEECRCSRGEFQPRHVRRPRFQPDQPVRRFATAAPDATLDSTGQAESSGLNEPSMGGASRRQPRFVLSTTAEQTPSQSSVKDDESAVALTSGEQRSAAGPDPTPSPSFASEAQRLVESVQPDSTAQDETLSTPTLPRPWESQADDQGWREEIAERVHKYRVRRRRSPRYPSLSLKFEASEPRCASASAAADVTSPRISVDVAGPEIVSAAARSYSPPALAARPMNLEPKIIEFPKPVPPPLPILDVPVLDELAEPIVEGPRILDAPEALPQIAPLAGITLDPPAEPASALELPLQVAAVSSRFVAAAIDGCFVLIAAALFSTIVFKTTSGMSARTIVGIALGVAAVLWAIYEYVLITYSGSTPGMEMAQMRLSCFSGESPGKRRRRGRALAMILSAVSFGLGFFWCLFDEDTLCWHDRITRTYAIRGPRGSIFAATGALVSRLFSGRT